MYGLIIRIILLALGFFLSVPTEWRTWEYIDRSVDSVMTKKRGTIYASTNYANRKLKTIGQPQSPIRPIRNRMVRVFVCIGCCA